MLKFINTIFTNQFFLMFLAIATGLMIGKIKIKSFSLGVSGGIFTGILIGYFVTKWAHTAQEGGIGYANAKRILSTGVVAQAFFTFFLLLFLVSIGLKVGNSIGTIFKKYGIKFVVIGVSIPVVSMITACVLYSTVLSSNAAITPFETIGMYAGAMTTTPGYGTALDAAGNVDYGKLYKEASPEEKDRMLQKIDPAGALTKENTAELSEEQTAVYKEEASSAVSLGYTVAFPMGVLVIVVMISLLPKLFRIDMEKEKEAYRNEIGAVEEGSRNGKEQPLNFMVISLVAVIGIIVGSITIPLGRFGSFSLGAAGGVLLAALILSYIGKIGPVNFRMDSKSLGIMYQMGLTFFMAVVGLRYGYEVVTSLMGSGLAIAVSAIAVEAVAVLASFFIGHKVFGLNWIILSGAIAGGCTSAPGLGAAISSTGSEEPTTGYGAAQPFAILANVLLATIFFNIML
ncbi:hypothetical protein GPL15_01535 [Clostridium sp. MCC353]|uniref:aspartate-alanine antiporter-like transporter n=1 Tax=Clostridium sp. MCC353 TaxID=2592646 RepID=UPI001C03438F|nr:hypothetical protein [Clostridium sp. MCC353]MBT9775188.1 hypothetical protein [Clostridium sp. MCC353]